MCRWLAYSGSPILLEELLYRPEPSLIDQSLHSRLGVEATNGDGFGVGWYGVDTPTREVPDTRGPHVPVLFRGIEPAWNDQNLRELARSTSSGLFFAHLRASTGSPVQQTNCHPFRHGRWLWMHNGAIRDFGLMKRDLVMAIAPELYPCLGGSTDSEVMFLLALTFGLEDDPVAAVERMAGFVEDAGRRHGIDHPLQMTVATSDGESLWAFRYSSEHHSRTLYVSTAMDNLRSLYPDNPAFVGLSEETRVVVSEPLGALDGVWHPFPESSFGIVQPGDDVMGDFTPTMP